MGSDGGYPGSGSDQVKSVCCYKIVKGLKTALFSCPHLLVASIYNLKKIIEISGYTMINLRYQKVFFYVATVELFGF